MCHYSKYLEKVTYLTTKFIICIQVNVKIIKKKVKMIWKYWDVFNNSLPVYSLICVIHLILSIVFSRPPSLASPCHLWTWTSGWVLTWTTGYWHRVGRNPTRGRHAATLLRRNGSNVPMALDRRAPRRSASWNLRTSTSVCTGRRQ